MTRPFDEVELRAYLDGQAPDALRARIEAAADADDALRAEIAVMRGLKALAQEDRAAARLPGGRPRRHVRHLRGIPAERAQRR